MLEGVNRTMPAEGAMCRGRESRKERSGGVDRQG